MARIAALKRRADARAFSMQQFCLDPTRATYDDIIAHTDMADPCMDAWQRACVAHYSMRWGYAASDSQPSWSEYEDKLVERALARPSRQTAMIVLHVFFALGSLRHLDLYYQLMGHERIPLATRHELASTYQRVSEMYAHEVTSRGITSVKAPADYAAVAFTWVGAKKDESVSA